MEVADIFVGSVAAAIGVVAVAIAAANWSPGFEFWIGRSVDARYGRTPARLAYAILGAALVALGVAIILGFAPNARRHTQRAGPAASLHVGRLDQMPLMH